MTNVTMVVQKKHLQVFFFGSADSNNKKKFTITTDFPDFTTWQVKMGLDLASLQAQLAKSQQKELRAFKQRMC